MSIRHEYRITASAEDAHAEVIQRSGVPASQMPDFSFTWSSHIGYSAAIDFVRNDDPEYSISAADASLRFWAAKASKWPSAKLIIKTISIRESVVIDNSLPESDEPTEFNESETGL